MHKFGSWHDGACKVVTSLEPGVFLGTNATAFSDPSVPPPEFTLLLLPLLPIPPRLCSVLPNTGCAGLHVGGCRPCNVRSACVGASKSNS